MLLSKERFRDFLVYGLVFSLEGVSFLALMQEKKQKKIKASGTPANFWDFQRTLMYPANFPALGRGPFLALMKEKNQKKIKAMIAIYFCLVHMIHGRYFVRLGEGKAIFAGGLLLCSLYMRKKRLHFFSIVVGVYFKNMF